MRVELWAALLVDSISSVVGISVDA